MLMLEVMVCSCCTINAARSLHSRLCVCVTFRPKKTQRASHYMDLCWSCVSSSPSSRRNTASVFSLVLFAVLTNTSTLQRSTALETTSCQRNKACSTCPLSRYSSGLKNSLRPRLALSWFQASFTRASCLRLGESRSLLRCSSHSGLRLTSKIVPQGITRLLSSHRINFSSLLDCVPSLCHVLHLEPIVDVPPHTGLYVTAPRQLDLP